MKQIKGNFYQKDIVSVEQFTREDIEMLFDKARFYKKAIEEGAVFDDLKGKIAVCLFYEPSSRTFSSFTASFQRLGGSVVPIHGVENTSVAKGETLHDTIWVFQSYSDVIIIRHPENGAALKAAKTAHIPIINAGDGTGEHPTQALLDLFTIQDRLGRADEVKVAMVGDLKYGRTVHSLTKLLSLYKGVTVYFINPPASPMPEKIVEYAQKAGIKIKEAKSIESVISEIDVLYMTRVQKERMDHETYEKIKGLFKLDNRLANKMKKEAVIMHPLPRVGEITEDVDENPRACYLKHQMRNGMFVRMGLLKLILSA